MKDFFRKLWAGWKRIAHKIGRFQTKVIITLFYFLVLSPFGGLLRLFGWDPLDSKGFSSTTTGSNWKPVAREELTPDDLRRQS